MMPKIVTHNREQFCEELVPVNKYIVEGIERGRYLDTDKFSHQLNEFFSRFIMSSSKQQPHDITDITAAPFIIGEAHSHISPKRFLMENLTLLKEEGFETLFLEHFFYDTDQDDLDDFFETGEMSPLLKRRLRDMNTHGMVNVFGANTGESSELWKQFNYEMILHAARQAGVRIVGIDISVVYNTQKIGIEGKHQDDNRTKFMNYTAYNIITREIGQLPQDKKWLALMGNSHVNTFEHVPGVAELNDVVSVDIFDAKDWKDGKQESVENHEIRFGKEYESGGYTFNADIIITTDPRFSLPSLNPELDKFEDFIHQLKQHISNPKWLQLFEPDTIISILSSDDSKAKAMKNLALLIREIRSDKSEPIEFEQAKEKILDKVRVVIRDSDKKQKHDDVFFKMQFRMSKLSRELEEFVDTQEHSTLKSSQSYD